MGLIEDLCGHGLRPWMPFKRSDCERDKMLGRVRLAGAKFEYGPVRVAGLICTTTRSSQKEYRMLTRVTRPQATVAEPRFRKCPWGGALTLSRWQAGCDEWETRNRLYLRQPRCPTGGDSSKVHRTEQRRGLSLCGPPMNAPRVSCDTIFAREESQSYMALREACWDGCSEGLHQDKHGNSSCSYTHMIHIRSWTSTSN